MVKINSKKLKEKKVIFCLVSLFLLLLVGIFSFRHHIEAEYKGVDVRYLLDPYYCESKEDCVIERCTVINRFNTQGDSQCQLEVCDKSCSNNKCVANNSPVCWEEKYQK
ncbi:MAG: hypothetical protein H6500_05575 [Candidatus Woesearchaeota archaeon]|nr:MAG: hypothetical protein H6500_05575 [Candidatus Woesearchaeota archaeon]